MISKLFVPKFGFGYSDLFTDIRICARTRDSTCSPNEITGGATSTSCSPNFFCNLQLKVTFQTVRLLKVTFNRNILANSPASGALLRIGLLSSKNTYCIVIL